MNVFRLGMLNVNRVGEARKRALVFDTAWSKRIDVLFLQGVHIHGDNSADWEKWWEGQVTLSHNTTHSGRMGFFFTRGFTPSSLVVEHVLVYYLYLCSHQHHREEEVLLL